MGNPSKRKGDKCELDAIAYLLPLVAGDPMLHVRPMRQLGAGRKDDIGDLALMTDTTIQVKACNHSTLLSMLRLAAYGAERQQANAGTRFGLGLVKFPGARAGAVRWIATALAWPGDLPEAIWTGASPARALIHVRDENAGPRDDRVARIERAACPTLYLAPAEAWLAARRTALTREGIS